MPYTSNWLVHDHLGFEVIVAECQKAIEVDDWESGEAEFNKLATLLKSHMAMEEEILYPAYESHTEFPQGPVIALREEHRRIAELIVDFREVIKTRNAEHALLSLLPLEDILFKHHEKEEEVFLPLAGYLLRDQMEELLGDLEGFEGP